MLQLVRDWSKRYLSDPQVIVLGILLIAGFAFVFFLGNLLMPVLVALVIAYLLDGLVGFLQKRRFPQRLAVGLVFLLFIAILFILILWLLPLLSRQISQLVQQLPTMLTFGRNQLMQLPVRYPELISENQIEQIFQFINAGLTGFARRMLSLSVASVIGLISVVVYLILVPILVFFFLKDKEMILTWLASFLPDNLSLASSVWREVNAQIANYVRGKGWEILIIWGISFMTFTLMDMQFSLLLSLFVGLSVIFPYIGVTVMFLPVALIAYFQWGWDPKALWAIVAYTIIQLLDGNLLAPLLLSEVINLHPIAIIIAVLVFGGLWGLWGLFFAIPLATLINAVIKSWFNRQRTMAEAAAAEAGD
ncbi:MAG: AI-2E family transporter [Desulfosarcinaceae bacterium]|nr:AI-2E family transporter [Desulfosarcinaceae bacterium]